MAKIYWKKDVEIIQGFAVTYLESADGERLKTSGAM